MTAAKSTSKTKTQKQETTFALPNLNELAPNGVGYMICVGGIFPPRD